jgi:xanthine dehydrogenase accessory factor
VIREGQAEANTGIPDSVAGHAAERVLRAPVDGRFTGSAEIGDKVAAGQQVGAVEADVVKAQIAGVVRGLLHSGISVGRGAKIGDIDPRGIREYCFTVSDKANAVAGGVLEAVLSKYSGRLR